MGRPINKRFLGAVGIAIPTADYQTQGDYGTNDGAYIVGQRSTNTFLLSEVNGNWQEVMTLVDKDAGSIDPGEFRIEATDQGDSTFNVLRLYNRTVRVEGNERATWNVSTPIVESIVNLTESLGTVEFTVADTSQLGGDVIGTITGLDSPAALNGSTGVISVTSGTTFEIIGIEGEGLPAYTSGGIVTVGDASGISLNTTISVG